MLYIGESRIHDTASPNWKLLARVATTEEESRVATSQSR